MFFSGSTKLTMDDKGRLAIPARLRNQLGEEYGKQIAITLGPACIEIYPVAEFRRIAENILKDTDYARRMRVQRNFVGNAVESEPDAQGRVLVPNMLRELKQLGNEVVLVGLNNHFELWPEAQWSTVTNAGLATYADDYAAIAP